MNEMIYGIVAGYDGSPDGARALRWAAREAQARGTTLTVCLAWTPDQMALPAESALCDLARQHGREILARGLPYAESVLGPGRVRAEGPSRGHGDPADAARHPARGAADCCGRRPADRGGRPRPRRSRGHGPRLGRAGRPAPCARPGRSRPLGRVQPLVFPWSQAERAWLWA